MSRMTGRAGVVSISDGGALAGVRRDRRGVVLGVLIAVLGVLVPLGGVSAARADGGWWIPPQHLTWY